MSHALDFTTGKAGIAYVGETPWHGLGQLMVPGLPLEVWAKQAGLDWRCMKAGVEFERAAPDGSTHRAKAPENVVLYRSDSGNVLSVVSRKYQPVQPDQVLGFYKDLTEKHGFQLETAGSLKGGRRIWALAKTPYGFTLRDNDMTNLYLLLATSFDGTMSTQARWTAVRVVCNNTIEIATQGRAEVVVPHSTEFNADAVKVKLEIGDAFEQYKAFAQAASERIVSKDEVSAFLLDVYLGIRTPEQMTEASNDEKKAAQVKKLSERMTELLFNSPGAHLASAKGTLWGVLNAVTRDADFAKPARSQENRLNSAWFGDGAALKQRALSAAKQLLAA